MTAPFDFEVEWRRFFDTVLKDDVPTGMQDPVRHAFYGGGLAVFDYLITTSRGRPEDTVASINALRESFTAYLAEVRAECTGPGK